MLTHFNFQLRDNYEYNIIHEQMNSILKCEYAPTIQEQMNVVEKWWKQLDKELKTFINLEVLA